MPSGVYVILMVVAVRLLWSMIRQRRQRAQYELAQQTRASSGVTGTMTVSTSPTQTQLAQRPAPSRAASRGSRKEATMTIAEKTYEQICSYLDAAETVYQGLPEQHSITVRFGLPQTEVGAWINVCDTPPFVGVSARVPLVVPEALRPQMAEAAVRANWGLALGRFDFDMSTGHLFFRIGMPLADDGVAREQFDALIQCSLWTVDRYFRAFGRLIFGDDLSPAEVIAEVEMARK